MNRKIAAVALSIALSSCSAVQVQPADPAMVARIVSACTASGLFKAVDGTLSAAVPAMALPAMVINAGIDIVCRDPARFAADLSTAEWVAKNLAAIMRGL